MTKRKGRRQPLNSEIKSLRRPAEAPASGEVIELEPSVRPELEPSDGELDPPQSEATEADV
jgi:hypothetical protein